MTTDPERPNRHASSRHLRVGLYDASTVSRIGLASILTSAEHVVWSTWAAQPEDGPASDVAVVAVHVVRNLDIVSTVSQTVPTLAIVSTGDDHLLARAVCAGARSVLPEGADPLVLVGAIHATAAGLSLIPHELVAKPSTDALCRVAALDTWERSCLQELAGPDSMETIAERSAYSARTFQRLISKLYGTLGVSSRHEAATFATLVATSTGRIVPAAFSCAVLPGWRRDQGTLG